MFLKPLPEMPTLKQVEQVGVKYYSNFGVRELTPDEFNEFCAIVHMNSATEMAFPDWLHQVRGMLVKVFAPEVIAE
jgi:hypothetical protein